MGHLLRVRHDPLGTFRALTSRFGDVVRLPLPAGAPQPELVIVRDPGDVRRVLRGNQANYPKSRQDDVLRLIVGDDSSRPRESSGETSGGCYSRSSTFGASRFSPAFEGVFTATDEGGVRFYPVPAPTDEEGFAQVLAKIVKRVSRLLRRRGLEAEDGL